MRSLVILGLLVACRTGGRVLETAPAAPRPAAARAIDLAITGLHGCLVYDDGSLACWGDNSLGQLGDGTRIDRPTPVPVKGLTGVKRVVVSRSGTCALTSSGAAWCWGQVPVALQIARGEPCGKEGNCVATPTQVMTSVAQIALDNQLVCARRTDGHVTCGGLWQNALFALHDVPELTGATDLALTRFERCGVVGGEAWCQKIGAGSYERRARGPEPIDRLFGGDVLYARARTTVYATDRNGGLTVPLPGVTSPTTVAARCALTPEGQVLCWGENYFGLLGHPVQCPDRDDAKCPQPIAPVPGIHDAIAFANTGRTACVVDRAGQLACWGEVRPLAERADAVPVSGLTDVTQLCAGDRHVCALRGDGTVACWGDGEVFQLGHGRAEIATTPVSVPGLASVVELACSSYGACARDREGTMKCWGNGRVATPTAHPLLTAPLVGMTMWNNRCGLTPTGTVQCELAGELKKPGDPAVGFVPGFTDIVELVGYTNVCGRTRRGDVRCAGDNYTRSLGSGKAGVRSPRAVKVEGISSAASLTAGPFVTLARRTDGSWWGWGGLNSHFPKDVPLGAYGASPLPSLAGVEEVAFADYPAYRGGSAYVARGPGGEVTRFPPNVGEPERLTALEPSQQLAHAHGLLCSVRTDRTVVCIGLNSRGQLGRGVAGESFEPVSPF